MKKLKIKNEALPLNGKADFYDDDSVRISFRLTPHQDVLNHHFYQKRDILDEVFRQVLEIYEEEYNYWTVYEAEADFDADHCYWFPVNTSMDKDYEEGGEV